MAGAVVWGSLYSLSLLATLAADGDGDTSCLWFPGLGPFIQLASANDGGSKMALALDGLGQAAGMTMLLIGLTTTKTILVRSGRAEVHVAPIVTREAHGFGLAGRF
jgi:hypothetical protein